MLVKQKNHADMITRLGSDDGHYNDVLDTQRSQLPEAVKKVSPTILCCTLQYIAGAGLTEHLHRQRPQPLSPSARKEPKTQHRVDTSAFHPCGFLPGASLAVEEDVLPSLLAAASLNHQIAEEGGYCWESPWLLRLP